MIFLATTSNAYDLVPRSYMATMGRGVKLLHLAAASLTMTVTLRSDLQDVSLSP